MAVLKNCEKAANQILSSRSQGNTRRVIEYPFSKLLQLHRAQDIVQPAASKFADHNLPRKNAWIAGAIPGNRQFPFPAVTT
jgi:hypothetical protein